MLCTQFVAELRIALIGPHEPFVSKMEQLIGVVSVSCVVP